MSKYLKILVAALAAVALATPAVAITLDAKGMFIVRGIMSDNVKDANDDTDDSTAAFDQRFRLMTTAALSDAVKMVVDFEADYTWGRDGGSIRADKTDELELRAAYLDFTAMDTNFKVGTQTFNLANGFIMNEQATGLVAKYRGLTFSYIKLTETTNIGGGGIVGSKTTTSPVWDEDAGQYVQKTTTSPSGEDHESLESDYYGASYAVKVGDFTLTPEVGYLRATSEADVYFFGAGAKGKVDKIILEGNLLFSSWDVDGGDDGLGTAAYAKAGYVDGPTSFAISAAFVGDEDNANGEFVDVDGFRNWSEMLAGGEFGNMSGKAGTAYLDGKSAPGDPGYYYSNYMYVRLDAGTRLFNEKSGIRAAYIYAQEAADHPDGTDAITFGHELDAYFDYAITKGLKWTTGGGYLFADDDLGPDDMWKLGTKLTYVF
ncbi:hypothetical protein [Desulfuromonas sp. AOP6]|uniref:hypothetical protein n=1 Tax=Desulfuromonas sp. AOP6 TaxID=1566351 RepID=UPI0012862C40|nr:hypothetical protein [Desulfuromonas sp. AOP6]BCA81114.1 hypothetical protein AOP6_2901 [Desulfuromonas sp. AOP6]